MKQLIPLLALVALIPVLWTGCASGGARRIETGGRDSITSVGQIDIQDFIAAAEASVGKLLASGTLDKVPTPPAIMAVSLVRNDTGKQFDTDLLTKKIRVKLNNSGKALTTTTVSLNDTPEDALAKKLQADREAVDGKSNVPLPDFSLSGKILETRARAGDVRQSTFSFQLSLTDKRGLALWEGEEEITKQGKRSSVGF
jgi:penicillin-binding protein activator